MRLRRSAILPNEKSPNESLPKLASFCKNENPPKPLLWRKFAETPKSIKEGLMQDREREEKNKWAWLIVAVTAT